jgi:uncharacterized protein (TIGR03435 family)
MRLVLSCVALVIAASGQSFEVATVKPAPPGGLASRVHPDLLKSPAWDVITLRGGPGSSSPQRIDYEAVTLKAVLARAYNVKPYQISGADWLADERYDIVATMGPETSLEQLQLMLQQLLTERFRISLHRDTKMLPVYLLTVAKSGPKFKPVDASGEEGKSAEDPIAVERARRDAGDLTPRGSFGVNGTAERLAAMLSSYVNRPVKDATQLEGTYSFRLEFIKDGTQPKGPNGATGPSIYAAVEEQLGLHLQASDEPTEILMIDKAEKVPTSN